MDTWIKSIHIDKENDHPYNRLPVTVTITDENDHRYRLSLTNTYTAQLCMMLDDISRKDSAHTGITFSQDKTFPPAVTGDFV